MSDPDRLVPGVRVRWIGPGHEIYDPNPGVGVLTDVYPGVDLYAVAFDIPLVRRTHLPYWNPSVRTAGVHAKNLEIIYD